MDKENLKNNEEDQDSIESKDIGFGLVLRAIAIVVWFFVYVSFFWFMDYRTGFEKVFGTIVLIIGFLTILTPQKVYGVKQWRKAANTFFVLSFIFILFIS